LLVLATLIAQIVLGPTALLASTTANWFTQKERRARQNAIVAEIPPAASVIAPASAEDKKMMKSELSGEKTVMVGGAAMFPSRNIIQNAVNSKDHTTLVAAVKAAGLVETLKSKGPFTVFAATSVGAAIAGFTNPISTVMARK
jgi:uncharacterized surface protein with fasciclin (FAS1) repeats